VPARPVDAEPEAAHSDGLKTAHFKVTAKMKNLRQGIAGGFGG
jgi:hypothetical protein